MASLPIDVQCSHTAPARGEGARRMTLVLGITAIVMGAEALGGWLAHSLALLADAGHMLADLGALGLALFVARMAQRPATPERSYGLQRLEILAALVNGAALIAIAAGIGIEAWRRFNHPPAVHASLLIGVAAAGLVANLASVRILHHGHDHSLNQRGAYLHVVSDALGGLGARRGLPPTGPGRPPRAPCPLGPVRLSLSPPPSLSAGPRFRPRQDVAPGKPAPSRPPPRSTPARRPWWTRCSARRGFPRQPA